MSISRNQQTDNSNNPYHPLSSELVEKAVRIAASAIVRQFPHCQFDEVQDTLRVELWLLCQTPWVQRVDPNNPGCCSFIVHKLRQVWASQRILWKRLNATVSRSVDIEEMLDALPDRSIDDANASTVELLHLIHEKLGTRARNIVELRMERYARYEVVNELQIPATTHDYEIKRISDVLVPYC